MATNFELVLLDHRTKFSISAIPSQRIRLSLALRKLSIPHIIAIPEITDSKVYENFNSSMRTEIARLLDISVGSLISACNEVTQEDIFNLLAVDEIEQLQEKKFTGCGGGALDDAPRENSEIMDRYIRADKQDFVEYYEYLRSEFN